MLIIIKFCYNIKVLIILYLNIYSFNKIVMNHVYLLFKYYYLLLYLLIIII